MPNMRQEPRAAAHSFPVGPGRASGAKQRRLIMRLTLLAGVAALSLVGAAGAQAQTIYTTDPAYTTAPGVVTAPGQVVAVPAPPFGPFTPQYVVTQPSVVVAPPT